jgi:hypothetical protein
MCFLRHARGFGWLDPFFSRASGVFLDTMAAPPHKWVSDGAPPLPCMQERAAARMGQQRRAAPTLHGRALNTTARIAVGRGFRAR